MNCFFHVNVNCSDFAASRRFYELLGFECLFEPLRDLPLDPTVARLLGLSGPAHAEAMVLMTLGGERTGTLLDLIQWRESPPPPNRRADALARGVVRVALRVERLEPVLERAKSAGAELLGDPIEDGNTKVACFADPDGTILELIEFKRGQASVDEFLRAFAELSAAQQGAGGPRSPPPCRSPRGR